MSKIAILILLGGCSLYVDDPSRRTPYGDARAAVQLDGTWPLMRVLVSANPVPPRTAPCSEGFTTGYQPSAMTIIGTVIGTDFGLPLTSVAFGGAHDLSFDAQEYWNTVGWNQLHPLHYDFDQTPSGLLQGTVTSTPDWPSGPCLYTYILSSKRQD
jgi:hypothetical protein